MLESDSSILTLARFLVISGSYQQALDMLEKADEKEQKSLECLILKGKIHAQQGMYEDAIKAWECVLDIEPGNEEARKAIKKAKEIQGLRMNKFYLKANLYYAGLFVTIIFLALATVFFWGKSRSEHYDELLNGLVNAQQKQIELTQATLDTFRETVSKPETKVNEALGRLDGSAEKLEEAFSIQRSDSILRAKEAKEFSEYLHSTIVNITALLEGLTGDIDAIQKKLDDRKQEVTEINERNGNNSGSANPDESSQ